LDQPIHTTYTMTTIFERTSSGIIYKPTQDREFPKLDLLSFLFG
jgi:hypothetical protein